MVINENNSYTNSFSKGMNSDSAYDQVENTLYTFGKNLRITKNLLLSKINSNAAYYREGSITPVYQGKDATQTANVNLSSYKILAVDSIDDIGVIVTTYGSTANNNHRLCIYRVIIDRDSNKIKEFKLWFRSGILEYDIPAASTVLYRELENVIKLYIASTVYPIISIRIDDMHGIYSDNYDIDYTISNRVFPTNSVYIENVIGGNLKTSQVLYTYRYYNKYGPTSKLAPLTNKIQVIDPNRNNETGNAEDTKTTIGFSIRINVLPVHKLHYERLLIFRLSYIKPDEDAEVALIYDDKLETTNNKFVYNDVGLDPLLILTIEEFASLSGIIIHPEVIENNLDYMFAANIVDDTIIKDLEITGNTEKNMVFSKVSISKYYKDKHYSLPNADKDPYPSYRNYAGDYYWDDYINVLEYFEDHNINSSIAKNTYNDIFTSSLLRSLRRGETYKYGIVFYDKYGRRSDVQDLGDVVVPQYDSNHTTMNPFYYVMNENALDTSAPNVTLYARPIGVLFKIPTINKKDIVGCQIVRRSSKDIYQKNLLQVALARPINLTLWTYNTSSGEIASGQSSPTHSPYYAFGYLTTDYTKIAPSYYNDDVDRYSPVYSVFNQGLFQAFSAEIDCRRNDTLSMLTQNLVTLKPICTISTLIGRPHTQDDVRDYKNLNTNIYSLIKHVSGHQALMFTYNHPNNTGNAETRPGTIKNPTVLPKADFLHKWYEVYQFADDRKFGEFKLDPAGLFGDVTEVNFTSWIELFMADDAVKAVNLIHWDSSYTGIIDRFLLQATHSKITDNLVFNYYETNTVNPAITNNIEYKIESIKDIKLPKWYEGFSNIEFDGSAIVAGIKQYKSYTTSIGRFKYDNWAAAGLYDLKIWKEDLPNVNDSTTQFLSGSQKRTKDKDAGEHEGRARGHIGPGPSCFLLQINENIVSNETDGYKRLNDLISYRPLGSFICNITHDISFSDVESDELVQYFGFGNFFKLEQSEVVGTNQYKYKVVHANGTKTDYATVFDGDVYITPHELVSMRKAYDFNSYDTLQSLQVINYVPLESKINTFFDYGMNFLNTDNQNMLFDGGGIDGVISQERPEHQYNMIYSSNDISNDVFSRIFTDKNETNDFPYRTYYSEPKINGEFIDNFLIHKAANFIDVDNKYGEITELMTNKNILYYWQLRAIGKFSVNERSLINDQNGNTIMLGQAGILSRYDYIDTKFGMRKYDFCAAGVDNNVYWVDINNKAVVAADSQSAVNYSERTNVQNIMNENISTDIPRVDYDVQNQELLCKCLNSQELLVFNLKYNIATSVYNRNYIDILHIFNHIYGLYLSSGLAKFRKYNYLTVTDASDMKHLTPLYVEFLVNKSASVDKVYDSQTIIPEKRIQYDGSDSNPIESTYMKNVTLSFETDIIGKNTNPIDGHTDREGNIIYNVPRYGSESYGNRMRGKWMKTSINKINPDDSFTISHVITKLRQSFS